MNDGVDESGGSVARRVASLLRVVGSAQPAGISTTEAAKRSGLNRSTTHRLLTALADDGFLDRDREHGGWFLGPEVYLLGALAAERYDIRHLAAERLRVIADATGESAYLSARRGSETVCLLEREGSFPLRSMVLHEGVLERVVDEAQMVHPRQQAGAVHLAVGRNAADRLAGFKDDRRQTAPRKLASRGQARDARSQNCNRFH